MTDTSTPQQLSIDMPSITFSLAGAQGVFSWDQEKRYHATIHKEGRERTTMNSIQRRVSGLPTNFDWRSLMPTDGMNDLTQDIEKAFFGELYYVYTVLLPLVEAFPGYWEAVICIVLPFLIVMNAQASAVQILKDVCYLFFFFVLAGPLQMAREIFARVRQMQDTTPSPSENSGHDAELSETQVTGQSKKRRFLGWLRKPICSKGDGHPPSNEQEIRTKENHYQEINNVPSGPPVEFTLHNEVDNGAHLPPALHAMGGHGPSQDTGSPGSEYACQPQADCRL
jgi:hypothetical protein